MTTTYEYTEVLTDNLMTAWPPQAGNWQQVFTQYQRESPMYRIVFRRAVSMPPPRDVNLTVLWRMASHARDEAQNYRDADVTSQTAAYRNGLRDAYDAMIAEMERLTPEGDEQP